MPDTFRLFVPMQVAISTVSRPDNPDERVQEGDIVVVRTPRDAIGLKERSTFLWLRVDNEDRNVLTALHHPMWVQNFPPTAQGMPGGWNRGDPLLDKRRFSIPLERLNSISPFDLARARDPLDDYQPFMPIDEDTTGPNAGRILDGASRAPIPIQGLVFDKAFGRYM